MANKEISEATQVVQKVSLANCPKRLITINKIPQDNVLKMGK